jgi:hypothetical protein
MGGRGLVDLLAEDVAVTCVPTNPSIMAGRVLAVNTGPPRRWHITSVKKGAFHVTAEAGVPAIPPVKRNSGEPLWRSSTLTTDAT